MQSNWRILSVVLFTITVSLPAWPAWTPGLAAKYLDERQKQWFEWPAAKASGGPCVSCHTGVTYVLARPMLRKALHETSPTVYETGLLDGLRGRMQSGESMFPRIKKDPLLSQARKVEAALAVMLLGADKAASGWEREQASTWGFGLNLDPWESDSSGYFGASMIAIGLGSRVSPETANYLRRELPRQPLHQKLMALWSGSLDGKLRDSVAEEVWSRQSADGGWTDAALGPWVDRPAKPMSSGSSAYATALVAFTMQQGGAGCGDARLERAKVWLESKQDPETGAWKSLSMNKKFPLGSMEAGFMDDAATGFAVMALLDWGRCGSVAGRREAAAR